MQKVIHIQDFAVFFFDSFYAYKSIKYIALFLSRFSTRPKENRKPLFLLSTAALNDLDGDFRADFGKKFDGDFVLSDNFYRFFKHDILFVHVIALLYESF